MPAWGVYDTFGVQYSNYGCVQEATHELTCEVATIRNSDGVTAAAIDKPLRTGKVSIKSKGVAELAPIQTGSQTTTIAIVSAKFTESNDDFGSSEVEAIYYQ